MTFASNRKEAKATVYNDGASIFVGRTARIPRIQVAIQVQQILQIILLRRANSKLFVHRKDVA